MMKVIGLCMWAGVVCMLFVIRSTIGVHGFMLVSATTGDVITVRKSEMSRQLQECGDASEFVEDDHCDGAVSLEDYRPYDPSPSSKAKVRPGPIEHGSPLMPYIPKPTPSPPHRRSNDDDESP